MNGKPIEQEKYNTKKALRKHAQKEIAGSYYFSSKIERVILVDLISYVWLIKFRIIKAN